MPTRPIRRRDFLRTGLLAGAAARLPLPARAQVAGANDAIRVGVAGLNGQGWNLARVFGESPDARVVAVCDPDRRLLAQRREEFEKEGGGKLQTFTDVRDLLDRGEVDVLAVAAPDHWHALAGIWAMQAGKDVYVEKPLTYCIAEGRRLIDAARRYERIAQTGSQHRSCPATHRVREIVQSGKLGRVVWAYAQVFNRRESIGKAAGPLAVPAEVDYDLYAGPATNEPPIRENLHYDWHWQWPMGTGETANWGAHIIDDALNFAGITELPRATRSVGGRLGYDDDGETPNTLLVSYEVGDFPLVAQFRALPMKPGSDAMDAWRNIRIGTVIQCENGYYAGGRGGGWIYDLDGERVEQVPGDGGAAHAQNFLDAVRSRRAADLNAPMQVGHVSAAYCHLANMSYRLGRKAGTAAARTAIATCDLAGEHFTGLVAHLEANGIDTGKPVLALGEVRMDPASETAVGPGAEAANALVGRRYRAPYALPEIV